MPEFVRVTADLLKQYQITCINRKHYNGPRYTAPAVPFRYSGGMRFVGDGSEYKEWFYWKMPVSEREKLVEDIQLHFRNIISQQAMRLGMYNVVVPARFQYVYMHNASLIKRVTDTWAKNKYFFVELDDGRHVHGTPDGQPIDDDSEDDDTDAVIRWLMFDKLVRGLVEKTFPYMMGQWVKKAYARR